MEIIGISCTKCNAQKDAQYVSKNLVECLTCTALHHHEEDRSYRTYDVTPLHVLEQRAQQQAIMDMWFETDVKFLWKVDGIDWSTCFQTEHEQFGVPF
tara:strand:- start:408 stop:701 length:294 start_codon:yes stop_codon:yes gene_type:complete